MRVTRAARATRSRSSAASEGYKSQAYKYEAASSEADLTAQRLRTILHAASDRQSALAGFAEALDPADAAQLFAILNDAP